MRRLPSVSAQDLDIDAPTPGLLLHGGKTDKQPSPIAIDAVSSTRRRDAAPDHAPGPRPTTNPNSRSIARRTAMAAPPNGTASTKPPAKDITPDSMVEGHRKRRHQLRNPWACSLWTVTACVLGFTLLATMIHSFMTRQLDPKGCEMCYMRPAFVPFPGFDTEHTRFASKYSLYLYREGGIDQDARVCMERHVGMQ